MVNSLQKINWPVQYLMWSTKFFILPNCSIHFANTPQPLLAFFLHRIWSKYFCIWSLLSPDWITPKMSTFKNILSWGDGACFWLRDMRWGLRSWAHETHRFILMHSPAICYLFIFSVCVGFFSSWVPYFESVFLGSVLVRWGPKSWSRPQKPCESFSCIHNSQSAFQKSSLCYSSQCQQHHPSRYNPYHSQREGRKENKEVTN